MGPDFSTRTIKARTNKLGPFVVVSLNNAPATDTIDLSLSGSSSPNEVTADNELTFNLNVVNNGLNSAANVKTATGLPPGSSFISAVSTQGVCKLADGMVVCKLGDLVSGANTTISVVVKPTDRGMPASSNSRTVSSTTFVRADQPDLNPANNAHTENVVLWRNPNAAPSVRLLSPANGATYSGQTTNITISAAASDSDGSISKVDFYDNGSLIGTATSQVSGQYSVSWTSTTYGDHSIIAIATDDLGKASVSNAANIFINGPAVVDITSPSPLAQFTAPASITIIADANYPNGSISKLDFYANGLLIGSGMESGVGQYSFNWSNAASGTYNLTAVAIDNNGVSTKSASVPISVYLEGNRSPQVSISVPSPGARFVAPSDVYIAAEATDPDGSISQVDFYNNGSFIGTGTNSGSNWYSFTWNALPIGNYSITAVASDNRGTFASSEPVSFVVVPRTALFLVGSTNLTSADNAVKSRLENLGFIVTVKDGASATNNDATGMTVVVISSTISPNTVGNKFRYVASPVVTWDSGLFYNMGMTLESNKEWGTAKRKYK